jgi:hypothetical protein
MAYGEVDIPKPFFDYTSLIPLDSFRNTLGKYRLSKEVSQA